MEEELFFIVFMIAANAILWTWQFVIYKIEERRKHENKCNNKIIARFANGFRRN